MTTKFEQRVETRKRLINSALALLTVRGFQKITLDEVAQKVGYSKGAIYFHFADKEALLEAVIYRLGELGLLWPPLPEYSQELAMSRREIEGIVFEIWVEARRQPKIQKLLLSFKLASTGEDLAMSLGQIVEHQVLALPV